MSRCLTVPHMGMGLSPGTLRQERLRRPTACAPPSQAAEAAEETALWVMLPLDSVSVVNTLNNQKALNAGMRALKSVGVTGVMVDVWWGVVEADGPGQYDWSAYIALVDIVQAAGLKLHAVMSFHACGCNAGDYCTVTLPPWVLSIGERNPDIFYTDRSGSRSDEYLSLGVDNVPLFAGRTPISVYSAFMTSFKNAFRAQLGSVISSVSISLGPAGELRYPAYREASAASRTAKASDGAMCIVLQVNTPTCESPGRLFRQHGASPALVSSSATTNTCWPA